MKAAIRLASIHMLGPEDLSDVPLAVQLISRAAITGDADALNFYGQIHTMRDVKYRDLSIDGCLFTGEPNYEEALKWFSKAVKAGNVGALFNIGQIHELGLAGEKNLTKALSYYKEVRIFHMYRSFYCPQAKNFGNEQAIQRLAELEKVHLNQL